MLVNCPECNSPVFVRSAAIEQRKAQRCYGCQAQLLVDDEGAVEIAVAADPDTLREKQGEGLLSATPGGPPPATPKRPAVPSVPASHEAQETKVLDLVAPIPEATVPGVDVTQIMDMSDEAVPIDDDDEAQDPRSTTRPQKVNAVFGGTVVSGEDSISGVPSPAPISFGDLDLGPITESPGPELPEPTAPVVSAEPSAKTETETETEAETEMDMAADWPTMVSAAAYQKPPPTDAAIDAQATVDVLAHDEDKAAEEAAPTESAPAAASAPHASWGADAMDNRETSVDAGGVHALTLEPSAASEEAVSSAENSAAAVLTELPEPTQVDATADTAPPTAALDRRFSITGDSSESIDDALSGEGPAYADVEAPAFPAGDDADISSPFSAALGGHVIEEFLTAGTLVADIPPGLIEQSRRVDEAPATDAGDDFFGSPGGVLGADPPADSAPLLPAVDEQTVVESEPEVIVGSLGEPAADIMELEPLEPLEPFDAKAALPPLGGEGISLARAPLIDDDAPAASTTHDNVPTVAFGLQAPSVLPHDSSPYVHQSNTGPGALAWAGALVFGLAIGAAAAWFLQPSAPEPSPSERALLAADEKLDAAEHEAAIEGLEAFLEEEPDHPAVRRRLAIAYAQAGHAREAELAFLRFLEVAEDEEDARAVRVLLGLEVPEQAEPEGTEPEGAEPEVAEPEVAEPEGTEPEVAEPEGTQPEGTEPEGTEPEVDEP